MSSKIIRRKGSSIEWEVKTHAPRPPRIFEFHATRDTSLPTRKFTSRVQRRADSAGVSFYHTAKAH